MATATNRKEEEEERDLVRKHVDDGRARILDHGLEIILRLRGQLLKAEDELGELGHGHA